MAEQEITSYDPSRMLELLERVEQMGRKLDRLRDQYAQPKNDPESERIDWMLKFTDADDENRELRARLEAIEELHVAPPGLGPAYCTECGQLDPCDTTKAVQGV